MAAQSTKTLRFEFLADTKKFLGNVGKVGKKFSDVGTQMKSSGDKINKVLGGIGLAAGAVATKSLGAFREFETGMNEVFTLLPGTTQEAFDKINTDVLMLSKNDKDEISTQNRKNQTTNRDEEEKKQIKSK